MYEPKHFRAPSAAAIETLVRTYPLAQLITRDESQQSQWACDPIPLIALNGVCDGASLIGHVAKVNSLWKASAAVLAVFTGPSAYISPTAYASKKEHHRVVPTFNYATVQVSGRLTPIHDAKRKLEIVTRMTERFEQGETEPWAVSDAPAEYIESMLNAIVGIEIQIETVVGKFKLSQNRTQADQDGVRESLKAAHRDARHGEMLQLMDELLPKA